MWTHVFFCFFLFFFFFFVVVVVVVAVVFCRQSEEQCVPMYYTDFSFALKIENFQGFFFHIFLIFFQNIDCGYTLEPPRRGDSNANPQSMFWKQIWKIGIPLHIPQFCYIYKSGVQGGIHVTDMFS